MKKKYSNSLNESITRRGNMTDEEWISHMRSLPSMILEEEQEDPTIVKLQPNDTIEDYMKRNNLVNGDEIISQIKNICNSYSQQNQNGR